MGPCTAHGRLRVKRSKSEAVPAPCVAGHGHHAALTAALHSSASPARREAGHLLPTGSATSALTHKLGLVADTQPLVQPLMGPQLRAGAGGHRTAPPRDPHTLAAAPAPLCQRVRTYTFSLSG